MNKAVQPYMYIYVYSELDCVKNACSLLVVVPLPIDVTPNLDRDTVHELIKKHVRSRQALENLYDYMRLPPLPASMPDLAGIDLWLLTCPCSWRELAWTFYTYQLPTAVIEVKKIFIEGDKTIYNKGYVK